jgi:hypothetical protein
MLSVSVKLTLLTLVLPIISLISLSSALFYFNRASIEASALLSTILVNLLVWERLRESAQKKLTWIHDNMIFKLYRIFNEERPYFWYRDVVRLNEDLKKYGKFLFIDLYPKNLLKNIKECVQLEVIFDKDLDKIQQIATKLGLTDTNMLYQFLDIDPHRYKSAFSPNDPNLPKYQEGASLTLKENPELINDIKTLDKKIVAMKKQIAEKLESFMKGNALRLEEKPTYNPYNHH